MLCYLLPRFLRRQRTMIMPRYDATHADIISPSIITLRCRRQSGAGRHDADSRRCHTRRRVRRHATLRCCHLLLCCQHVAATLILPQTKNNKPVFRFLLAFDIVASRCHADAMIFALSCYAAIFFSAFFHACRRFRCLIIDAFSYAFCAHTLMAAAAACHMLRYGYFRQFRCRCLRHTY